MTNASAESPTLGQTRVGHTHPTDDPMIVDLRQRFAELIDILDRLPCRSGETIRIRAIAMTEVEAAAGWSVKAASRSAAERI